MPPVYHTSFLQNARMTVTIDDERFQRLAVARHSCHPIPPALVALIHLRRQFLIFFSRQTKCYASGMKFILVVTDTHGKNLAFVSNDLQTLSLSKATEAVRRGDVAGACVV